MILIGLGSNLGEREKNITTAKRLMIKNMGAVIVGESPLEETKAILPPGSPPSWDLFYLNQVIAMLCTTAPLPLLKHLKHIERTIGRLPSKKWAPRIIDLDILWYHGITYSDPELVIPHPQMVNRPFITQAIQALNPKILDKIGAHHL